METIEFVKNNFLGMSYENQRIILETWMNFLNESKIKKISKKFNESFLRYLEKIDNLLLFKELYKSFNSDKKRLTRKIVLDELIKQVDNHHIDNSDKRIIEHFLYSSEEVTDLCKIEEYKRYFKPQAVSEELVQKFLIDYSNLSTDDKCNLIEETSLYYDRLSEFSLPCSYNMLLDYRPIIQNIIGDDLIEYYDHLYSEEKIELIISVVTFFKKFEYDNDYYNEMILETKKDPKIIRNLKKEAISSCHYSFKKSDIKFYYWYYKKG